VPQKDSSNGLVKRYGIYLRMTGINLLEQDYSASKIFCLLLECSKDTVCTSGMTLLEQGASASKEYVLGF